MDTSLVFIFLEVLAIATLKDNPINEQIKCKEMMVIGPNGEQLGVKSKQDALTLAGYAGFDLVLMSDNGNMPVCKIMDLGKYIYEQAKKEKEAKKKQKVTVIKEIRCGITIEENDIAIKAKNARKFLVDGDKVKITIRFKGREAALSHLGVKILDNFVSKLEDVCVVEKPAKQDGRNMTMVLAPKKA